MVIPSAPWLKLWRNSLEHLGKREKGWNEYSLRTTNIACRSRNTPSPGTHRKLVFLETNPNQHSPTRCKSYLQSRHFRC